MKVYFELTVLLFYFFISIMIIPYYCKLSLFFLLFRQDYPQTSHIFTIEESACLPSQKLQLLFLLLLKESISSFLWEYHSSLLFPSSIFIFILFLCFFFPPFFGSFSLTYFLSFFYLHSILILSFFLFFFFSFFFITCFLFLLFFSFLFFSNLLSFWLSLFLSFFFSSFDWFYFGRRLLSFHRGRGLL